MSDSPGSPRLVTSLALLAAGVVAGVMVLSACGADGLSSQNTRTTVSATTRATPAAVAPSTTELPPLTATRTVDPGPGTEVDAGSGNPRNAPSPTTRVAGSGTDCLPTDQQSVPGQDAAKIDPPAPGVAWWVDRIGGTVCPGLSWAALNVYNATGSSPWQLLIYHNGYFLGTGTRCNLPYQKIIAQDRESVTVGYRYAQGDDPGAAPSGSATVTYRWNGSRVVMDGSLPYALTKGRC